MKSNYLGMLAMGVALTAISAGSVYAQDSEARSESNSLANEDIIVTATRREQSLQATPLAVTAITADSLRERNISGLGDISNGTVPGIRLAPFAGTPSILAVTSRGVAPPDVTQATQELAVPLYIDGIPLGRAQGLGLDLIDPERIEFLRGPQGQLFGRNAEGGAIQFVSRRPSGELGLDVSAELGNYGHNRQRLRIDLPEIGKIRIQAALLHNQHNAFTKNGPKGALSSAGTPISEQADYGYLNSFGYRVAAEWNPFENLRVNYAFDNTKITDSQPYMVWVPVDIVGRTPSSPMPAGKDKYPGRVNSPTYNEYFVSRSKGHGLTIELTASDSITLKSISSYREASRHGSSTLGDALVAGGSASGILRSNAREDVDQKQWYQEVQAIGSWDNFDLTVGGTYFKEKVIDERRSRLTGAGFNAPALGLAATLVNCIGRETCMVARSEQNAQSDSYGIYAQGTYTPSILDERLELTAGIRYSNDKKDAERTYIQPPALPPYSESQPSGPLPAPSTFKAKRWDPAVTIKYNFTDQVNAYFRYATAYRAGGVNVRSSQFLSYREEEIETFELGLKSRLWDNRLTLNAALYRNEITGFQNNIQESPVTNPSLTNTVNSDRPVTVKGLELEATLRVAEGLTLGGTYSYMDAKKFREYDNPLTPVLDVTRFYSVQTPKHQGSVAADYETPDLGLGKIAVHADYAFSTDFWVTPGGLLVSTLGPTYKRPAARTNMLNGRISLKEIPLGTANGEIGVWGKNILNDKNYTFGFDGAASGGGFAQFLTEPFRFGVELRVRY